MVLLLQGSGRQTPGTQVPVWISVAVHPVVALLFTAIAHRFRSWSGQTQGVPSPFKFVKAKLVYINLIDKPMSVRTFLLWG